METAMIHTLPRSTVSCQDYLAHITFKEILMSRKDYVRFYKNCMLSNQLPSVSIWFPAITINTKPVGVWRQFLDNKRNGSPYLLCGLPQLYVR